jgi:hypothetical protein
MKVDLGLGTFVITMTVIPHAGADPAHRGDGPHRAMVPPAPARFRQDSGNGDDRARPFAIHTMEVWNWAVAYSLTGALPNFRTALYFSTATFSTLGYGDIVLTPQWQLLGSLEGVNGFLLLGWSTAYLVAASNRYGPFRTGEHF